ncbi:hypothetical protein PULV_a3031 [Pseudoalteromonas ulvae UL12]|nr:hypothetical protein [Pseudoalteromonas ulvae UL12]
MKLLKVNSGLCLPAIQRDQDLFHIYLFFYFQLVIKVKLFNDKSFALFKWL